MVLATLTAHHLLERVDYPQPAYRFDHQQLQEYFAALDLRRQLLDLRDDESNAIGRFTADYVNQPVWGEPLRMIAASLAEESGDAGADRCNARAGAKLVQMALAVDLVFAGELAQLCGATVWDEVGTAVGGRFRAVYAMRDGNFQHYAVAAMLATGMGDFSDIVVPLLSVPGPAIAPSHLQALAGHPGHVAWTELARRAARLERRGAGRFSSPSRFVIGSITRSWPSPSKPGASQ